MAREPLMETNPDWEDSRRVSTKFGELVKWVGDALPREKHTIVGDAADLYVNCSSLRRMIDDLLATPITLDDAPVIRAKARKLEAKIEHLGNIVRDIMGPLGTLCRALRQRGPSPQPKRSRASR